MRTRRTAAETFGIVRAITLVGGALIICSCAVTTRRALPHDAGAHSVAGTYEIQICDSLCVLGDTTKASRLGIIVLDTLPLLDADLSERERDGFESYVNDSTNLCYVLRDGPREGRSMAGVQDIARYQWSYVVSPGLDSASIQMQLYGSSDAFYFVRAYLKGDGFEGVGESSGAGAVAHSITEYIVGRRVGPPRTELCRDAARNSPRRSGTPSFRR